MYIYIYVLLAVHASCNAQRATMQRHLAAIRQAAIGDPPDTARNCAGHRDEATAQAEGAPASSAACANESSSSTRIICSPADAAAAESSEPALSSAALRTAASTASACAALKSPHRTSPAPTSRAPLTGPAAPSPDVPATAAAAAAASIAAPDGDGERPVASASAAGMARHWAGMCRSNQPANQRPPGASSETTRAHVRGDSAAMSAKPSATPTAPAEGQQRHSSARSALSSAARAAPAGMRVTGGDRKAEPDGGHDVLCGWPDALNPKP